MTRHGDTPAQMTRRYQADAALNAASQRMHLEREAQKAAATERWNAFWFAGEGVIDITTITDDEFALAVECIEHNGGGDMLPHTLREVERPRWSAAVRRIRAEVRRRTPVERVVIRRATVAEPSTLLPLSPVEQAVRFLDQGAALYAVGMADIREAFAGALSTPSQREQFEQGCRRLQGGTAADMAARLTLDPGKPGAAPIAITDDDEPDSDIEPSEVEAVTNGVMRSVA